MKRIKVLNMENKTFDKIISVRWYSPTLDWRIMLMGRCNLIPITNFKL